MLKKIAVVTATRAEYGILKNVIDRIEKSEQLKLCLMVTGTHLVSEYGRTAIRLRNALMSLCLPIHRHLSLRQWDL